MKRFQVNYFGKAEARIVPHLVRALPQWVTPDMMTLLSIFGASLASYAVFTFGGNALAPILVSAGIFLNWYGDSTDGALARHRQKQRPIVGFWIDRLADTFCFVLLFLSLGISPYLDLSSSYLLACTYLFYQAASLNLARRNRIALIGVLGFGATEARLTIVVLVLLKYLMMTQGYASEFRGISLDRIAALIFSTAMVLAGLRLLFRSKKNIRPRSQKTSHIRLQADP